MRKLIVTLFALIGLGASGLAFALGPDGLGITDSPHDFTDGNCYQTGGLYDTTKDPGDKVYNTTNCTETTWNDTGQICAVCHVPHAPAADNAYDKLLWNHGATGATTWVMYDSSSLDVDKATAVTGLSLLCLGCHDGIQGIDVYGTHAGTGQVIGAGDGGTYQADAENLLYGTVSGTELNAAREHPVSIEYDNTAATGDPGLHDPAVEEIAGRKINDRLEGTTTKLVQCHSCHDVHNGAGTAAANQWLLREPIIGSGTESQLCLACHDK